MAVLQEYQNAIKRSFTGRNQTGGDQQLIFCCCTFLNQIAGNPNFLIPGSRSEVIVVYYFLFLLRRASMPAAAARAAPNRPAVRVAAAVFTEAAVLLPAEALD